jgi:hypothetical protein
MGVLEGGEGSTMQRIPMLRDDAGKGGGRRNEPKNVLGDRLEVCSLSPMTGFLRDGCCDTSREDIGSHTVCAVMTAGFLEYSKSCGNDLSTPVPESSAQQSTSIDSPLRLLRPEGRFATLLVRMVALS